MYIIDGRVDIKLKSTEEIIISYQANNNKIEIIANKNHERMKIEENNILYTQESEEELYKTGRIYLQCEHEKGDKSNIAIISILLNYNENRKQYYITPMVGDQDFSLLFSTIKNKDILKPNFNFSTLEKLPQNILENFETVNATFKRIYLHKGFSDKSFNVYINESSKKILVNIIGQKENLIIDHEELFNNKDIKNTVLNYIIENTIKMHIQKFSAHDAIEKINLIDKENINKICKKSIERAKIIMQYLKNKQ